MEMINALGRRKSAVARIFVTEGTGKITINKRDLTEYFPSSILQFVVKQPLNLLDAAEKYDIKVNLQGGGFTGQSQALRLAIARALVKINADDKKALRAEGFVTRDSREVERKKPGRPKARRRFQFSKRKSLIGSIAETGKQRLASKSARPVAIVFIILPFCCNATIRLPADWVMPT